MVPFTSKKRLIMHLAIVHEGKKPVKCKICNSQFADKATLDQHIDVIHKEKLFAENKFEDYLESGTIRNLSKNDGNFSCSDCSATFIDKDYLEKHIESVHIKGDS